MRTFGRFRVASAIVIEFALLISITAPWHSILVACMSEEDSTSAAAA
jgi:hypothetical protein